MVNRIINEGFDIILGTSSVSQLFHYQEPLSVLNIELVNSKFLGYNEVNTIAARTFPGKVPLLAYFNCYSKSNWLFMLITLLTVSALSTLSIKNHNSMLFRNIFCNYIIVLVKQPMNLWVSRHSPSHVISIWLMSAFILTTLFTAYFFDFMVRTVPLIKIRTLEDLYQREGMKIIVRSDSSLIQSKLKGGIWSKDNNSQFETYFDFKTEGAPKLINGLNEGRVAYINNRLPLIFTLIYLSEIQNKSFENIYISSDSAAFEPYFSMLNKLIPPWAAEAFNRTYVYVLLSI